MVATGLAAHGYQFINIDDGWEGARDAGGVLQPNEKFPNMKALTDYVHSKGLKIGIYSSPGPRTCQGLAWQRWAIEEIDARTWAEWGFDLLKHDWCSYGSTDPETGRSPICRSRTSSCATRSTKSIATSSTACASTAWARCGSGAPTSAEISGARPAT